MLARRGFEELLCSPASGGARVLPTTPQLVMPLRSSLKSRSAEVIQVRLLWTTVCSSTLLDQTVCTVQHTRRALRSLLETAHRVFVFDGASAAYPRACLVHAVSTDACTSLLRDWRSPFRICPPPCRRACMPCSCWQGAAHRAAPLWCRTTVSCCHPSAGGWHVSAGAGGSANSRDRQVELCSVL